MSLHLWEAVHDADVRSDPLFLIDPDVVEHEPPSLQRVLLAAAALWCRSMTWPTVREISTTAAVAASTSIRATGSSAGLRRTLIAAEVGTIAQLCCDLVDQGQCGDDALPLSFEARTARLAAIEPTLARLPILAGFAGGWESVALVAMSSYGPVGSAQARRISRPAA